MTSRSAGARESAVTAEPSVLEGGCFCRAIRYRVAARPSHETLCHCSICRRTSGAPVVAWFSVPRDAYVVSAGEPAQLASSDHGTRTFCARCGTPLTFASTYLPDEIDVSTCSLDRPESVPPRDHTQTSSRLPWLELGDAWPRYPGYRFEGAEAATDGGAEAAPPTRARRARAKTSGPRPRSRKTRS